MSDRSPSNERLTYCDSCRQVVSAEWAHSCYRACRVCGQAIEPAEDYCGACKAREGT